MIQMIRNSCRALIAVCLLLAAAGCGQDGAAAPVRLSCVVVKEHPHDPAAFTQGLAWDNGAVYEGTGLHGRSSLRRVDLASGRVIQQRDHSQEVFAEGVAVLGDSVYQLTWNNRLIFQHDKASLSLRHTFPWPREGWGLTQDTRDLILSDGTAQLYFLDPQTMTERRRITVHDGGREIALLNELEYVGGSIYANIWMSCRIAVIRPEDGAVTAWLDLSELCRRMQRGREDVLNGIMHDPVSGRLFVTGKLWPVLFEIRTTPGR